MCVRNQPSNLLSENLNNLSSRVEKLLEGWRNRLNLPATEIGERYLRGGLAVLLNCRSDLLVGRRISLCVEHLVNPFSELRVGKSDVDARHGNGQFPMLVESVHVVNEHQKEDRRPLRPHLLAGLEVVQLPALTPVENLGLDFGTR
jgi:hypothetical protein